MQCVPGSWIASRSLSSGAHSRDPLARNDGAGAACLCLGADRLDIVAVGIDQERGKIGRAVILARARCAIVAASGLQPLAMEFFDRGVIGRAERDMRAGSRRFLVKI